MEKNMFSVKLKYIAASTLFSVLTLKIQTASADPDADIQWAFSGTECHKEYDNSDSTDEDKDKFLTCIDDLRKETSKELNEIYQNKMKNGFSGPHAKKSRKALKDSQEAWQQFKNADCDRISLVVRQFGTIKILFCDLYHSKIRIAQLKSR
ncbi:MAG: DUF1311 domain-containing protein [Kistimonas sp.]|nr:DUF1311 domain-containing protein [Kistimonas sp.]